MFLVFLSVGWALNSAYAQEVFHGEEAVKTYTHLTTSDGRIVRARLVYRSNQLSGVNQHEMEMLPNLKLESAYDLRTPAERKYRPGWAAAALLTLLGVLKDKVMKDYLRSNDYFIPAYRKKVIYTFVAAGGDEAIALAMPRTASLLIAFTLACTPLVASARSTRAPDSSGCDLSGIAGAVWWGTQREMTVAELASYVAPVFWFSPDGPSLNAARGPSIAAVPFLQR